MASEQKHKALGIDVGTAGTSACYSILGANSIIDGENLHNVSFLGRGTVAPNIISKHEGRIVWGFELADLVADGKVADENVVDFLKLGM